MAEKNVNITLSATDKTRGAFVSAEQSLKRLTTTASTISTSLGGLLPAIGVAGLATFAKQGIDAADALNDMSARTGVAVKTLAEYKLAAQLADTSLDDLAKGIQRLSLSQGQAAQGMTTQAKALQTLGITARDPKLAFEQLADAVANSTDPLKTNAALNDVLGRSYVNLLPLLQGGAKGLRDSADASKTFAEQMAKLAPDAAKFNDQLDLMRVNAAGAAASILSELVPSLNQYIGAMRDILETGSLIDKIGFFTLGFIPEDTLNRISDAGDRVQDYNVKIFKLQQQLVEFRRVEAAGSPNIRIWEDKIAALEKTRAALIDQARKDAADATKPPPADSLVNYGADVQAALKKAFATNPLDDFLATFKDRRKKIVDEYKALRADLAGGPAGEATTLDVSLQLTKGRAALAQGDASGAQAAAAKAKELFAEVAKKEGTASFEKSYFSRELETFELSIVDSAESAAVTAQKVFTEKLATLNQDASNLTINVDAAGLTAQVKSVVDQLKKDLAADPLRIPVVAVPSISSDGRQSVDLSTAALQYGGRR